jgi:hypothetical protein
LVSTNARTFNRKEIYPIKTDREQEETLLSCLLVRSLKHFLFPLLVCSLCQLSIACSEKRGTLEDRFQSPFQAWEVLAKPQFCQRLTSMLKDDATMAQGKNSSISRKRLREDTVLEIEKQCTAGRPPAQIIQASTPNEPDKATHESRFGPNAVAVRNASHNISRADEITNQVATPLNALTALADLSSFLASASTDSTHSCRILDCGKSFGRSSDLKRHMKQHQPGQRPAKPKHQCTHDACEKSFGRSNDLKRHMLTHTGQKSRKCSIPGCSKSYSSSTALRYHMSTHDGEKPVPCEYPGCDKTFALRYVMKQHLPSHRGIEKPFKCDHEGCSKAYVASSALIQHRRKHTGEKPFKCTVLNCSKAYVSASGLIPHMKKHFTEAPLICLPCSS